MADLHVAVVPFSAFGHIMPFLQLSIALANSGVRVSFITTPSIIRRLPQPPPQTLSLLRFVPIPLPTPPGGLHLPPGAEATVDIPLQDTPLLKVAYDLLQHPVRDFLAKDSPHWLLVDFAAHWAADLARHFRIPLLYYVVFSSAASAFFGSPDFLVGAGKDRLRSTPDSLTSPPEWFPFPSTVSYRRYDSPFVLAGLYGSNASGISDAHRIATLLSESCAVAVRTCPEVEPQYLELYRKLLGKPVIPVGLLPPEKPAETTVHETWADSFEWLDEQQPRSVVFVGFGSECKLTKAQVHEIANGLYLSGLPFLWALRKPDWAQDLWDALPAGWFEIQGKRGRVRSGWAPQIEILAHPSIGGSLFHSGWGSAIETLQHGHCMVLLPFIIDQPLNARMLVDKGLAVEVERNEEDGSFTKESVAKCLLFAMVSEEGRGLRLRAREAAKVFGDQELHKKYVAEFVKYLMEGK